MCEYGLHNVRHLRVPVGYVLGLLFSVDPFKGERIKLEYDKEAFDIYRSTEIHPDEDEQLEYYKLIAKKEGQFKVEGGLLLADGTLCLEESYLLDVVGEIID